MFTSAWLMKTFYMFYGLEVYWVAMGCFAFDEVLQAENRWRDQ